MRRFLVVGCGGSGGATLAYLMDQLRSDLSAHGITDLPRGWQFLHIDVPAVAQPGPGGLGNVAAQGGSYLGTGPRGASFGVVDQAVAHRLAEHSALDTIGTWAPRNPAGVAVPIAVGAGQYRAVGRLITLSRAADVHRVLRAAWEELFRVETATAMRLLRVPGLGDYDDGPPLVFVVSSMAGGAGASMALDVCRLLTLLPGVEPSLTAVFMAAPNVFDALPDSARTGVRANALAMLGEIIAAQAGSARRHDVGLLAALGLAGGNEEGLPFARVFPVGRHAGVDKALFGDGSPEAVYRGLGRGLAGMIMSGTATSEFVSYDLAVPPMLNMDRDLLGWGCEAGHLPWGSYGFAALSMGRERYAEYAAQRLANSCVHQLLDGRLPPDDTGAAHAKVTAQLGAQWPNECRVARLPLLAGASTPEVEKEAATWIIDTVFPRPRVDAATSAVTDREVRDYVPDPVGRQAQQWGSGVRALLAQRRSQLVDACTAEATRLAYRWQDELRGNVERTVTDAIARMGLSYAVALVERMAAHLRTAVSPAVAKLDALGPADVSALPPDIDKRLAGMPRGTIQDGGPLVEEALAGYHNQVRMQIYATASGLVHEMIDGFSQEVLDPLLAAVAEAQHTLSRARRAPAGDLGVAQLATDHVPAWPTDFDEQVPGRFDHADNEVLLTTSADFGAQYDTDLRRAPGQGVLSFGEARDRAVVSLLTGQWPTVDAGQAPGSPLAVRAAWRSRVFAVAPDSGRPLTPTAARYDLGLRPAELLLRARAYVARRGESFDQFCRLSIRDFVAGDGSETESELIERREVVAAKFDEALVLARPLISVDATALSTVHSGQAIAYRYKFSEVPLRGLEIAERLRKQLTADLLVDPSSLTTLDTALGESSGVNRIDIFGSYPNYSPLVFDAVLTPVAEQWSQLPDLGREEFWQWRRARPLVASLPMGDAERRAMVGGWFTGQIVGAIEIPEKPYRRPVRIWAASDPRTGDGTTEGEWLDFPYPLLTPPSRFLATFDWLPAVLESVLLALARSHEHPVMASLRPYRALRGLYDTSRQDPVGGILQLAAADLLGEWVRTGTTIPGEGSRVPGADSAATAQERQESAIDWLVRIGDLSRRYLTGGDRTAAANRGRAGALPLFADLAGDVRDVTAELVRILRECDLAGTSDPMDGRTF